MLETIDISSMKACLKPLDLDLEVVNIALTVEIHTRKGIFV